MKIFQIKANLCFYDATPVHSTLLSTLGKYPPNVLFVEAPDYVFEGWGYDPTAEGEARFIQPIPPAGWLYDEGTGTFYEEGEPKPSDLNRPVTFEELAAAIREGVDSI